jgi:exosome complex component CSL4
MTEKTLVMPGDQLSTSEELLSGDGTYEEDGIIRAARVGHYVVDEKHRRAFVKPVTSIPIEVRRGDTVLAEVRSVKSSMIIADVIHVSGKDRAVSGDTNGTLRVSEISRSYVKDPATEYAPGDILRAKVTQVKPSIQLATKDRNLGAIRALCTNCRHVLQRRGNSLECPYCGHKETRRLAEDYGVYNIDNL